MPNAFVKIGSDNRVTILSARSEMGQGTFTTMPTLVAEELEVDLGKIRVEIAPAGEPYINTMLGGQITGGSTSVAEGYDKLRMAGAQARTMLVQAAAQKWGVDPAACRAQNGAVSGPNGQQATYGDLAEAASKLPVPKDVKLKEHKDSRYVGKPVNRLDSPGKIDGTVDLGALATEFLLLGIDPYPRKPGAVFEPPSTGDPGESPFAALAGLRTGRGKRRG